RRPRRRAISAPRIYPSSSPAYRGRWDQRSAKALQEAAWRASAANKNSDGSRGLLWEASTLNTFFPGRRLVPIAALPRRGSPDAQANGELPHLLRSGTLLTTAASHG